MRIRDMNIVCDCGAVVRIIITERLTDTVRRYACERCRKIFDLTGLINDIDKKMGWIIS